MYPSNTARKMNNINFNIFEKSTKKQIKKSISFRYILLRRSCTPPYGLPADSENPYVFQRWKGTVEMAVQTEGREANDDDDREVAHQT